uniref:Uncharacterized protein n=1 Tax=Lactuca sativa TaxID=4236 RepID=A0A9R1VZ59_LACSA|nr:hypothetical protein LSAT_V11C300135220 [Lactuca sativa]
MFCSSGKDVDNEVLINGFSNNSCPSYFHELGCQDDFVDEADISSNLLFFNISRFMYGSSVKAGIMNCSCESFVVHLLVKMFLSSKSQLTSFLEYVSLIIYYCLLLLFYDKVMKVGCVSMYSAFIFYLVIEKYLEERCYKMYDSAAPLLPIEPNHEDEAIETNDVISYVVFRCE